MKRIRYTPPNTTWFVTNRCIQAQYLLRPDKEMTKHFGYWLGRALRLHPGIQLIAAVQMSNHFHFVLQDKDSELSSFLCYFEAHLATSTNKHRKREGPVFSHRFSASAVLDGEALLDRIIYTVMNPIKAGLVRNPEQWPGVILFPNPNDQSIEFRLFDHTRKNRDKGAGIMLPDSEYERFENVNIHASKDALTIEQDIHASCIAKKEERKGKGVVGVIKLRTQDPFANPKSPKKSRRPLCHAGSGPKSTALSDAYKALIKRIRAAHADASATFRSGQTKAQFPLHTFCPIRFCPT
jgi:putative transposase